MYLPREHELTVYECVFGQNKHYMKLPNRPSVDELVQALDSGSGGLFWFEVTQVKHRSYGYTLIEMVRRDDLGAIT